LDGLSTLSGSTLWQPIRPGGEGDALNAVAGETVSLIALLSVLAWAVTRPRGWPEAIAAVPAAVILIAAGVIPADRAADEARRLGPVIGFLAAILVLAHLCEDDGLFRACGDWMARASAGSPRRLLAQVFLIASVTTAVLSLDATVVLLTPVVFATAARLEARARPHVYACTHLANSASLLLPVSNLTNLLAFTASGLAFGRFVVDHAACPVLLVWPGSAPDVASIPPPPHHPSPPGR
jgi:arsenical pump membrane protein